MGTEHSTAPKRELGLFDSACIIVGIIVGVGIFETTPAVAAGAGSVGWTMAFWILGGALSLCGALCIAELASAYPEEGGEYVYLRRAFGPTAGYLFAWSQFIIIRPGSIAATAFPFAHYLEAAVFGGSGGAGRETLTPSLAAGAIVLLTALNIAGLKFGRAAQNVITSVKVLAIVAILLLGFYRSTAPAPGTFAGAADPGLALILILFTYGGWNEIGYVAAEVRNPQHNIFRAVLYGTVCVTLLYLLLNAAFFYLLGFTGVAGAQTVVHDAILNTEWAEAAALASSLICLSAFGALNGLILTGARISFALGQEHVGFGKLGVWNAERNAPDTALIVQAILSCLVVVLAGSFQVTVVYTTAVVWCFFAATGAALMVLRTKHPQVERPYKVPAYPLTPLIFFLSSSYLVYAAVDYDLTGTVWAFVVMFFGLPLQVILKRLAR